MKTSVFTIAILFLFGIGNTYASVQTDIETVNKSGKAVFLVVTESGNSENTSAIDLAREAQKLCNESAVIEMNRTDKANEMVVEKYGLAGTPAPFILVIASNGIASGGAYYKQATSQSLVAMLPSPKKADVLKANNEDKSVFIVISKKTEKKKETLSECEKACAEMEGKAKIVEIDFDDPAEKEFLNDLKITQVGDAPQIVVVNSQGQITGSYTGLTDIKDLVAAATKKKSSGCCAPGSGKSCGPKKQ